MSILFSRAFTNDGSMQWVYNYGPVRIVQFIRGSQTRWPSCIGLFQTFKIQAYNSLRRSLVKLTETLLPDGDRPIR